MNKKYLAAGAGIAVLAISASFCLTMGDSTKKLFAEDGAHKHTDSCKIHHYEQVDPTSTHYGVKEYWICCSDSVYMLTKPSVSDSAITTMTHTADFELENGSADERYIAPYTFPDVFKTQMAYSTTVTVDEDGKVTSPTGTITIKAGVLKDAYESGYTHMKFHSNADSSDVTNILGTQSGAAADSWKSNFKRYQNDQDNRFWLKSFSDKNESLKIDSLNLGNHVDNNLTLSDFNLFKSSTTESWGGGVEGNTYIAFENGELVLDNCGADKWKAAGTIPAEYWSSEWASVTRNKEFYVKKLASGGYQNATTDDNYTQFTVKDNEERDVGYMVARSSGTGDTEEKTDDGFANVLYGGYASSFGLQATKYRTSEGFPITFNNPSAWAIRFNYDLAPTHIDSCLSYKIVPLAFSSEGNYRVSLANVNTTAACQSNIPFVTSKGHKGINLKITSDFAPTGTFMMSHAIDANLKWPTYTESDGTYSWSDSITFKEANPGLAVIFKTDGAVTDGTITFEYSWID